MAMLDRFKSLFASRRLDVRERFELLREAISGTMSKVYMARDRKTGKIVSLKILDPKKTAFFEARFKGLKKPTEGAIAIQFNHPYIVKTFEHGLTTKGEQYLEMEYLGGPGLNSLLVARDGSLDGRRVTYIRQVAEALDAVHNAGFIHRDICPRNLILTEDREVLKLTDFGLTVPATPPFMQPGNRTGTPNYMAPELVRRRHTDQRLDVFAFGVTIYEMLTGELPWLRGTTGQAAMTHDQPPTDIRIYRPTIDPDLARAVHSCIEPDLKKRCPSMEVFLREIRRVEKEDA
ncbi:MAG: serine/threonine protein kinase [Thermoguttaceae bacterium]|nr:serine/threonine protein kinase [Thermoguttaceae bacterium]